MSSSDKGTQGNPIRIVVEQSPDHYSLTMDSPVTSANPNEFVYWTLEFRSEAVNRGGLIQFGRDLPAEHWRHLFSQSSGDENQCELAIQLNRAEPEHSYLYSVLTEYGTIQASLKCE